MTEPSPAVALPTEEKKPEEMEAERKALLKIYWKQIVHENAYQLLPMIALRNPSMLQKIVTTPHASLAQLDKDTIQKHAARGWDNTVEVLHSDTLNAAIAYTKQGYKVGILNNANGDHPTGSYTDGNLGPQEENLCARSTLSVSLLNYGSMHNHTLYPIPEGGVIVTEHATIFRDDKFNFMPVEQWVDDLTFLSAAGYDMRALIAEKLIEQEGEQKSKRQRRKERKEAPVKKTIEELSHELFGKPQQIFMVKTIVNILRAAVHHGVDCPILGALGCGIFSCPPTYVAYVFQHVLKKPEFNGAFRKVVFAITNGEGRPCPNYECFKRILTPEQPEINVQ